MIHPVIFVISMVVFSFVFAPAVAARNMKTATGRTIPAIDAAAPAVFNTASFGLG